MALGPQTVISILDLVCRGDTICKNKASFLSPSLPEPPDPLTGSIRVPESHQRCAKWPTGSWQGNGTERVLEGGQRQEGGV